MSNGMASAAEQEWILKSVSGQSWKINARQKHSANKEDQKTDKWSAGFGET